jgi:hypothetical protein
MNRLADNISATQLNRRSPKYAFEATERLHERETDLDDARKTALRDLFELDEGAASVYVVLTDEILRKNWIQRNLKDMGFPGESRLVYFDTSYKYLTICSQISTLMRLRLHWQSHIDNNG